MGVYGHDLLFEDYKNPTTKTVVEEVSLLLLSQFSPSIWLTIRISQPLSRDMYIQHHQVHIKKWVTGLILRQYIKQEPAKLQLRRANATSNLSTSVYSQIYAKTKTKKNFCIQQIQKIMDTFNVVTMCKISFLSLAIKSYLSQNIFFFFS